MGKPLQDKALLRDPALARIEAAVAKAEAASSSEFVVVLAPSASRYEGRALRAGALAALVTFVVIYWVLRLGFGTRADALYLLAEAIAMGALVTWASTRFDALRRYQTGGRMRSMQVTQTAGAAFHEQKVAWTKEHNGALLFVSVMEGEARLLGDLALQSKVSEAKLNEIQATLNSARDGDGVALIEEALVKLGALCAKSFPRAAEDVNELPDKPVIRLP